MHSLLPRACAPNALPTLALPGSSLPSRLPGVGTAVQRGVQVRSTLQVSLRRAPWYVLSAGSSGARTDARTVCVCVCVCYLPFVSRADLNVVDHEEGAVGTAELLGALTSHGWVIDFRQQVSGVRVGLAALGGDGVPLAVVCRTHMSFSRCCCRAWTTNWYALVCVCHVWPSPVDVSGAASVVPYSIPVQTEDRSLEHFGQRAVLHQASVSLRQAPLTLKWACML